MIKEFEGKKLLILGGNFETCALVEVANEMGIQTIVTSARHADPAKKVAWKARDVDGLDVPGLVALAREEGVDGVLTGVADILVPSYCKVCDALGLPCYATQKIVDVFSYKDMFKAACEHYGVHGVPEFYLDDGMKREDLEKIVYPVMVKPVDNGGGTGISVAYDEEGLVKAVKAAQKASVKGRFIVEKYMRCDDVGLYYTFKDGYCSVSCVYDRFTTAEQPGFSRVCLGGIYPSRHLDDYFGRMHDNIVRMFRETGIRNGVLMLSAFYENGEFYVYDTGFRLQGEAPHLLMKAIHGFDQREMLVRFALSGSEGSMDLKEQDDVHLRGKWAATVWFLLKEGKIASVRGLEEASQDRRVADIVQRLHTGDVVRNEWVGNEKQVLARLYLVCDSREELRQAVIHYQNSVKVTDENSRDMVLKGFDVKKALDF